MTPNAIVILDRRHLLSPLTTFEAMKDGRFVAEFRGAKDIDALSVTVFTPCGSKFAPVIASQDANGDWHVILGGQFFPTVGRAKYEIVGLDSDGTGVPLGRGEIVIGDFNSGTVVPSSKPSVVEIPDDNGIMHRVKAVLDEAGEWTWKFID